MPDSPKNVSEMGEPTKTPLHPVPITTAELEPIVIRKPRFSLRLKLTLGLIVIIGIVFAGLNTFNVLTHRNTMQNEATTNRETIGRVIVAALTGELANHDIHSPAIKNFLHNFLTVSITQNTKNQELAFAIVIDTKNQFIAGRAKPRLTVFPGPKRYKNERKVITEIARLQGKLGSRSHMRTARFQVQVGGKTVGRLLVGTSMARLRREFRRDLIINLSVFVVALFLLIVYATLTLGQMVIRPITKVMDAMRAVRKGNLDTEVHLKGRDEIGVLADTYNFMVKGLREREELKDAFSRYVSTQVYEKLRMGKLTLTGEMRNATVLFSDIRSFTALSERLAPPDVVRLLNEYFNVMVDVVFKYDGFLNKFIGDALMAIYNVPIDQPEPELRAVSTALEMMAALEQLNQRRADRGQFAIKIGIGINTGPVVSGNIGHMQRLEYTVIGDTVNLAQRIESQTKVTGMPVLISEATYRAVANKIVAKALPAVKVKGKQEPVPLFAVTSMRQRQEAAVAASNPAQAPQQGQPQGTT